MLDGDHVGNEDRYANGKEEGTADGVKDVWNVWNEDGEDEGNVNGFLEGDDDFETEGYEDEGNDEGSTEGWFFDDDITVGLKDGSDDG
jgi:hypothetical protein